MANVRYLRYKKDGAAAYGLLTDEDTVWEIRGDIFAEHEPGREFGLDEVTLLSPVQPGKVVCVGLNYRRHAVEIGLPLPPEPVIFLKPPSAVVGPGEPIVHPTVSRHLEYEGELAVVIGRRATGIPPERAGEHIFGYTCANDVTARDLQHTDRQWDRAKGFDTFLPLGPWVVTQDLAPWRIRTILNGAVRQDASSAEMVFSVAQVVSFISGVMTLYPGDVVLTGTPPGTGPLVDGDRLEVRIEGIGGLLNPVISQEKRL